MGDPYDVLDGSESEQVGDEQKGGDRPRGLVVALVLLLLLLLCAVVTSVDAWVSRKPDEIAFVTRNLDCLQCHTELIPSTRKASVHNPFLLKSCTTCHTPHGKEVERSIRRGASDRWQRLQTMFEWLPLKFVLWAQGGAEGRTGSEAGGDLVSKETVRDKGEASSLKAPEEELCWICHGDLGVKLDQSHPHAPFAGGYCTNCHDPHASDFRVLLNQDERDLCLTCHPIGPELARKQTHPPVAERYCTNCHDPHASDWKGILVDNQRDLCFVCHPSVAPLSMKAVQHAPFVYDNCTGCHEPHGSDFEPLLIKNDPGLCYDCHPVIAEDFNRPSHHPVGTIDLVCADCHDPHGADFDALVIARDNEMCYECHRSSIGVSYEDSKHRNTLCISCHTPHGSDFEPILQAENPLVCFRCHPGADETYGHPVRRTYWDVAAQESLTCSSTCHNPHGSPYVAMVGVPYKTAGHGADNLCLTCHAKVGAEF